MTVREAIIKALDDLSEETLEGVWEYIQFAKEPPENDAAEEELEAIAEGEGDYARGDFAAREDIKTNEV